MTASGGNVIPFGKYQGKTIDELLITDPQYLQWLCGQDWFRSKFVILHQVIVNQGKEPEDTPEHNALQAMFLNQDFCKKFMEIAFDINNRNVRRCNLKPEDFGKTAFEVSGVDVVIESLNPVNHIHSAVRHWHQLVEIKPSVGDDYPAVLRQINAYRFIYEVTRPGPWRMKATQDLVVGRALFLERYVGSVSREQFVQIFTQSGVKVVFKDDL